MNVLFASPWSSIVPALTWFFLVIVVLELVMRWGFGALHSDDDGPGGPFGD